MTHVGTALVVGAGSIGRRHARNLVDLGITAVVTDPDPDARARATDELGIEAYDSMDEALDSDPDIAVIGTPTRHHVEGAMKAARAGCHLLIEKPLSHEITGVDELETIISECGLVTLVGCNMRFHPAIRRIYNLLRDGTIGDIVAARFEGGSYLPDWFPDSDYRNSYSARTDLGGGVILDYIHEINYARWFLGEFETVSAIAGQRSELEIETNDVAGILVETADGVVCEFHLDYVQRAYSRSCHIVGERGTIRWSWDDECVKWYTAGDETWHTFERPTDWDINDMYVEEMNHFLECIEADEETTCPVNCGRQDLAVALAARESATTGRHVTLDHQTEY
jgi:predicted dehydrogenase